MSVNVESAISKSHEFYKTDALRENESTLQQSLSANRKAAARFVMTKKLFKPKQIFAILNDLTGNLIQVD